MYIGPYRVNGFFCFKYQIHNCMFDHLKHLVDEKNKTHRNGENIKLNTSVHFPFINQSVVRKKCYFWLMLSFVVLNCDCLHWMAK